MRRAIFAFAALWLLVEAFPVEAQKVHRIGGLIADETFMAAIEGFKQKMAVMGYVDGKSVLYDLNNAQGDRGVLDKDGAEIGP